MLTAVRNKYGGVFVSGGALPGTPAELSAALAESLEAWSREGVNVAWIQLPSGRAGLLSAALEQGFEFRHCTPGEIFSCDE